MSWPEAADVPLVLVLRALPADLAGQGAPGDLRDLKKLFTRAELHGCAGVLHDALSKAGVHVESALDRELSTRRVARELDHSAHLAILRRVDEALADAGLRAVVMKGALFAERFYPQPAARATSDVDLLVAEAALEAAARALERAGYGRSDHPDEARFRAEHHHLHLAHEHALPLELHFHAYRGFGRVMRSEPFLARSEPAPGTWRALRVLSPSDELVYLAVHAAAHRFVRIGWLLDMKLLAGSMTEDELARAAARARELGFGRVYAFAADLLERTLGTSVPRPPLGRARRRLAHIAAPEPPSPVLRSMTRFVYTTTLCDSPRAAARYATASTFGHVRRILRRAP